MPIASPPLLVVQDANLLIDLHCGGLLEVVFMGGAPWEIHIPDVVLAELRRGTGPVMAALVPFEDQSAFITGALSGEQVAEAAALTGTQRRLTFVDCAAYVYARQHQAILLTGDNLLRTFAQEQQLSVHGTLWMLDQLVDSWQVLSPAAAHQALTRMMQPAAGRRLPATECAARLTRWLAAGGV